MFMRWLYALRYISLIAVVCSFLGSILAFCIGAIKTYKAFTILFSGVKPQGSQGGLNPVDLTATYLIKSVDAFLIALVFMVFSYGVYNLFISRIEINNQFEWINIPNISHLKHFLAEIIIIITFVKFLEFVVINLDSLSWEVVLIPVSILLLALGLKFLDLRH